MTLFKVFIELHSANKSCFWQTNVMPKLRKANEEKDSGVMSSAETKLEDISVVSVTSEGKKLENPQELGGPKGPEPTRFGDWERAGRCIDF